MSSRTINKTLTALGFDTKEEMTVHGFRAMARTLAMESNDRAEYMEQRKVMMTIWADYLDRLRAGADVIQLPVRAT